MCLGNRLLLPPFLEYSPLRLTLALASSLTGHPLLRWQEEAGNVNSAMLSIKASVCTRALLPFRRLNIIRTNSFEIRVLTSPGGTFKRIQLQKYRRICATFAQVNPTATFAGSSQHYPQ